jgi:hypothetical protein
VDDYQRVLGEMASGTSAWAYGFQALLICSWAVYLYNQPTRVQKFQVVPIY